MWGGYSLGLYQDDVFKVGQPTLWNLCRLNVCVVWPSSALVERRQITFNSSRVRVNMKGGKLLSEKNSLNIFRVNVQILLFMFIQRALIMTLHVPEQTKQMLAWTLVH